VLRIKFASCAGQPGTCVLRKQSSLNMFCPPEHSGILLAGLEQAKVKQGCSTNEESFGIGGIGSTSRKTLGTLAREIGPTLTNGYHACEETLNVHSVRKLTPTPTQWKRSNSDSSDKTYLIVSHHMKWDSLFSCGVHIDCGDCDPQKWHSSNHEKQTCATCETRMHLTGAAQPANLARTR